VRKSRERVEMLDGLSELMWGRKLSKSLDDRACVKCGGEVVRFRDRESAKEYDISGWCQKCQDEFWVPPERNEPVSDEEWYAKNILPLEE